MRPYLDFSFLIHLVVLLGERSRVASEVIQPFRPPFPVTDLHILQVENFFRYSVRRDPRATPLMANAAARWRNQISELVFEVGELDWQPVIRHAIAINRHSTNWPGTPLALLHLQAAQLSTATHLFSFDSHQRTLAVKVGLQVLPETLS